MNNTATVFIIDDDQAVRDSLESLFAAAGYTTESFAGAEAFLATYDPRRPGCLLLDMQMPGMGGLGLQKALAERKDSRPIIFLTAHGTVPMTVRALKNGAFDFLEKPADGNALLDLVSRAIQWNAEERQKETEHLQALRRCDTLTEREYEILKLVVAGKSNKEIGRELDISHRTVELHRMRVMQKTGTHSVIELAALAQTAGLTSKTHIPTDTTQEPS